MSHLGNVVFHYISLVNNLLRTGGSGSGTFGTILLLGDSEAKRSYICSILTSPVPKKKKSVTDCLSVRNFDVSVDSSF